MEMVADWLGRKGKGKNVAYFFEAGGPSQSEFNRVMQTISQGKNASDKYAYNSHTFAPKLGALPLQASDMLAWQVHHFHERCAKGHKKPRADYRALIRPNIDEIEVFVDDRLDALKALAKRRGVI